MHPGARIGWDDESRADEAFRRLVHDLALAPVVREEDVELAARRLRLRACTLTKNEVDVLSRLAAGETLQQVADALGKGRETVKTQLKMARLRLGAKTVAHACSIALRRGLID